ncbi:hypothetical protein HAX54_018840 [Datura stramonium]|uniref:Thaumatin-like protein n=1 Tax=Datura stramonium TaxID=4076 RepID=A0ABS8RLI1_DATST|nr:hypothetical protein [Datura stramonium]
MATQDFKDQIMKIDGAGNAGHPVLERGGFTLHSLTHRSFPAPAHWSAEFGLELTCNYQHGKFYCATGDCGGRIECDGLGGAAPATLAQFALHHGHADFSSYGVSLVDGFNIPLTVTPHEVLQFRSHGGHGPVVGCKSGCEAYKTDELCCRNHYNSPQTCKPSTYSQFFKHACPATFTYAHDSPTLMHGARLRVSSRSFSVTKWRKIQWNLKMTLWKEVQEK